MYTHAECFLCHEIGHLTRNCPTNEKGIYPHGGGCHHCGANDHFARLCPKKEQEKRDENKEPEKTEKVAVGLLDNKQSGDADVVPVEAKDSTMKPRAKKQVVKF